jgi:hypothetical protein
MHKNIYKNIPPSAKIPQKNSTQPEITHIENENKKMFKRKKGASK